MPWDNRRLRKCDDCNEWKLIPERNLIIVAGDEENIWQCMECAGEFDPETGEQKEKAKRAQELGIDEYYRF